MVISEETKREIAAAALRPIFVRLAGQAYDDMVEEFCRPRCGHAPEKQVCNEAQIMYSRILTKLHKEYSRVN